MPKLHKVTQADITTAKGLAALQPSEQPYYHKVNKGVSIGVYKPGTGTVSWRVRIRHEGKYRVETLEDVHSYTDAVLAAAAFVDDLKAGAAPTRKQKSTARLTVQELIVEYIDSDKNKVAKGDRYEEWKYTSSRLSKRYVYPYIGNITLNNLGRDDIQDLQTTLRQEVSPETTNRGTVTLRAALNYALAKQYVSDPFWKTVSLEEEAEADDKTNTKDYFEVDDREAFIAGAGEHLAALVKCMHLTGCRPSEARRLTVGDVHVDKRLKQPYVRFKTFKGARVSGTGRKFPLANGRLAFFQDQVAGKKKTDILFPTETGIEYALHNLNQRHNAVRNQLEIDGNFQTYTWRHCWITDMIHANVQPLTVAKLAGTSLKYIQENYTAGDDTLAAQLPEI